MINEKTSLLVPSQLPEFVRDNPDYANFNLFVQAYYEWMETTGQVTDRTKNLLAYKDIEPELVPFLGNCIGALATQIVGNRESITDTDLKKFVNYIMK